ncbi:MAG: HRDC domain-containing protein [Proteobacteria bacterium]|nr:HRDC domain-containing protein [Pseudomonadota bacterium]
MKECTPPLPPSPDEDVPFTLVEETSGLESLARELEGCSRVAVDLEADSMYHYQEKVCLVQISARGKNWMADPLAVGHLSSLAPMFADPKVRKVLHGSDYDIRSLHRDFGIEVKNLFDTQLAACFLGYKETGLASLLASRFDVHLEKKYQKSNWSRRPLPAEMLAYAARDTAYLLELASGLRKELKKLGRLEWVEEESQILTHVRVHEDNDSPLYLRFKGAGRLDPRTLAVLEEVLKFRNEEARRLDRPPFKVMGNQSLLNIAEQKPKTMKELEALSHVTSKQAHLFGRRILPNVHQALALSTSDLPVYPHVPRVRMDHRVSLRVQALKDWRTEKSAELSLDPGVMLSNTQIRALALTNPRDLRAMGEVEEIRRWQVKALGEEILTTLAEAPKKPKKSSQDSDPAS